MACATFHLPPLIRKFALPPGTLSSSTILSALVTTRASSISR